MDKAEQLAGVIMDADLPASQAAEIEQLRERLGKIERLANIPPSDDSYGSMPVRLNKIWFLAR
jgi:hypothetical protein